MADAPSPWAEVARRIDERIDELKLTNAEVLRRSGLSYKTLARYLEGKPIRRRDKERGLCEALGWTTDSIARILRGEEPEEALRPLTPEERQELFDLRRRVAELEDIVERSGRPPANM